MGIMKWIRGPHSPPATANWWSFRRRDVGDRSAFTPPESKHNGAWSAATVWAVPARRCPSQALPRLAGLNRHLRRRIPANLTGPTVPGRRGPTEAGMSYVLAGKRGVDRLSELCWPQLTPLGLRKALTRKVRVGDAAPRLLSCLQGGWYTGESSAGFQPKNMRKPGVSGTCIDYRHSPRERRATAPLTSGNLSVCHLRLGN